MIDGEVTVIFAAILTSELIPVENFLLGEFYIWAGAFDDVMEADYGWFWIAPGHSSHYSTAVHDHIGFANQNQAHRPASGADVNRCVIAVEDQHWMVHFINSLENYSMYFNPFSRDSMFIEEHNLSVFSQKTSIFSSRD